MKRFVILFVTLCLLTGCTTRAAVPAATATPTEAPTTAPTAAPTEAPTAAPTEAPTAAPTEAPSAAAEKNGMYELLTGVFDSYHAGVAGSSLVGAWYAASLVDFAVKNGAEAVARGTAAWDRGMETEFGESFPEKLSMLYVTALSLTGPYRAVLEDAGYTEAWGYTPSQVREAFAWVFDGLGRTAPTLALVWYPDENAEGLRLAVTEAADFSAQSLTEAMKDVLLTGDSAILSLDQATGTVLADMNDAFAAQVRGLGSGPEALLIGALVNSLLDTFDARQVKLTVNGQPLETGHDVYDAPMERFGE